MKNKSIKLFILGLLFISFIILIPNIANANSISKITMDIFIEDNGDANVTEVWETTLNQGTEGYRSYKNLGEKVITDFSVVDNTGKAYETVSSWNSKNSFSQKAYKCGIKKSTGGIELCWGISEYGNKKYKLNYKINNFVVQYSDDIQGIYFNFLDIDQPVNECYIRIRSNTKLSLDNSRIWSFGYDGDSIFKNGSIQFISNKSISKSQYIVGLIRFQEKIFNVNYKNNDKTFDDIYDSAMVEIENYSNKNTSELEQSINDFRKSMNNLKHVLKENFSTPKGIIKIAIFLLLNPITLIIIVIIFTVKMQKRRNINSSKINNAEVVFSPYGKEMPDEIPMYRDIPCNKDIHRAYWVCYNYDLANSSDLKKGFIGALFLKWIKDGSVKICKTKKGLFSLKDDNYAIDLRNVKYSNNQTEKALQKILLEAAGINKILEAKEFKKWSIKNNEILSFWFDSIIHKECENLYNEGLLELKQQVGKNKYYVSKQLYDDAVNIKGLKKFLLDYSLINEKQAIEVHIWEEYLMFAHLMGIADKVQEQFRKLYPNIEKEIEYNYDIAEEVANRIAEIGYQGMREGIRIMQEKKMERDNYNEDNSSSDNSSRHDYSGTSRDSGGGGSSYSSGGRSAGGSSGGGFR